MLTNLFCNTGDSANKVRSNINGRVNEENRWDLINNNLGAPQVIDDFLFMADGKGDSLRYSKLFFFISPHFADDCGDAFFTI